MKSKASPYDAPSWRRSHTASSPDSRFVARIDGAVETGMSGPTYGQLAVSDMTIPDCSPTFVWSSDSRFLAVPQWKRGLMRWRRQRLLIVDVLQRLAYESPSRYRLLRVDGFDTGCFVLTNDPFGAADSFRVSPKDAEIRFKLVRL